MMSFTDVSSEEDMVIPTTKNSNGQSDSEFKNTCDLLGGALNADGRETRFGNCPVKLIGSEIDSQDEYVVGSDSREPSEQNLAKLFESKSMIATGVTHLIATGVANTTCVHADKFMKAECSYSSSRQHGDTIAGLEGAPMFESTFNLDDASLEKAPPPMRIATKLETDFDDKVSRCLTKATSDAPSKELNDAPKVTCEKATDTDDMLSIGKTATMETGEGFLVFKGQPTVCVAKSDGESSSDFTDSDEDVSSDFTESDDDVSSEFTDTDDDVSVDFTDSDNELLLAESSDAFTADVVATLGLVEAIKEDFIYIPGAIGGDLSDITEDVSGEDAEENGKTDLVTGLTEFQDAHLKRQAKHVLNPKPMDRYRVKQGSSQRETIVQSKTTFREETIPKSDTATEEMAANTTQDLPELGPFCEDAGDTDRRTDCRILVSESVIIEGLTNDAELQELL